MKNSTTRSSLKVAAGLLLVLLAIALSGCLETRYTIRSMEQHHGGAFNTVQTTGERVVMVGPFEYGRTPIGVNYWNCRQYESELVCERICDEVWNQTCRPDLRGRFGAISRPNSGVAVARHIARTSQTDESWDTGLAEEEETSSLDGEDEALEPTEATQEVSP